MAASILVFSLLFALAMAGALAVLILRRRREERAAPLRAEAERSATQSYLRRSGDTDLPCDNSISVDIRLRAVTRLSRLLRGSEREALVGLVEADGLLDASIADLHGNLKRRASAVQVLENFASERCVDALTALMIAESDPTIQLEAASALARLGRLPPPRETLSLLRLHERTINRVHLGLLRSLAPAHHAEIAELALKPRLARLRPLLVESLGWSQHGATSENLASWSCSPDADVRWASLLAAQHLGHPRAAAWVLPRLADTDASVRVAAVEAAQKLGLVAALPALRALRGDPAAWVAVHAERAVALLSAQIPAPTSASP